MCERRYPVSHTRGCVRLSGALVSRRGSARAQSLSQARRADMRRTAIVIAGLAFAFSGAIAHAADKVPKAIAAAVADKNRPEADTKRDEDRKPAECVAYAGIKAGDKVVDLLPGGGYFTRIFSKTVGPKGHVYAVNPISSQPPPPPAPGAPARPEPGAAVKAIAANPEYANVSVELPTF